ncbi:PREDICTED: zinc-finger homeodomain protein 9-like [Ipomoea nil]|uniref:zinc-finger homeodomain protein 9-like n=1 Tax=Ipomoea nil TaxID=35883 RepID=UPI0009012551|nr:PREDICTED: zinc-finger homeodomain protein 9-like [Ipomoea nil]
MEVGGVGSNNIVKTPEAETETPTRLLHHPKPLSFSSNGVLKRHNPLHHHHHHHAATYKECLKNHAASLGGHAVDGCGEFMPSPTASSNPTLLKCAACGCHRNFHRREPEETKPTPTLEYQSLHRHHPPPPNHGSPNSLSPPPISSSAPHMLLALSTAFSGPPTDSNTPISASGRKRFRTKFTQDQKHKMLEFADKVGWKIQKRDEELINQFCSQVGVERGVLKVWMHNNKNTHTLCKTDQSQSQSQSNATNHIDNVNGSDFHIASRNPESQFNLHQESNGNDNHNHQPLRNSEDTIAINGSSSSS